MQCCDEDVTSPRVVTLTAVTEKGLKRASSPLLEDASDLSSDDGVPSISSSDLKVFCRSHGILDIHDSPYTSAFPTDSTVPTIFVVGALREQFWEISKRIAAVRRSKHEHNRVIFPILRKAKDTKSPFSILPKDMVRKIAFWSIDNRADELCAMFTRVVAR